MNRAPGRDRARPDPTERHFRIGTIDVSLGSDLEEALDDFASLYSGCVGRGAAGEQTIHMEVRAGRRTSLGRPRYTILGDGEELFANRRRNEVLPYLEWGINWRVIARRSEYVQLHAATLAYQGQAVVFAGPSGTGKSTLAAALLARGWSYLSDEFALIDPVALHVHPFPKALCIKAGSFAVVEHLRMPIWRRRHYVKAFKGRVGYISVKDVARQVESRPRPIRFVIFPKYAEGDAARLYPVERSRATFALAGHALNRDAFGGRTISILSDVVRGAECFGLASGPLDDTCDLVEHLF